MKKILFFSTLIATLSQSQCYQLNAAEVLEKKPDINLFCYLNRFLAQQPGCTAAHYERMNLAKRLSKDNPDPDLINTMIEDAQWITSHSEMVICRKANEVVATAKTMLASL